MAHADGPREAGARSPGPDARITAVVLNYRTPSTTRTAIASLVASDRPPDQIIVVDNDGDAASHAALLDGLDARIGYLSTATNLGFSGGMNVGIRRALDDGAAAVLIVNSDAGLAPDCLGALEDALRERQDAGIAGPVIRSRLDPGVITSLGLRYERRFGRMRDRAGDPAAVARAGGIERVDAVTGCLMLVRRDVFAAIGLLDEDYFFSFEDLDFCLKAAAAGYASVLVRSATVFHEGSRSIGPDSPGRLYFAARNHLRAGARLAPPSGQLTAAARFISIVALNTAHAIGAPGGTLLQRLAAVWEGTRDYLAGRFGGEAMSRWSQGAGG